MQSMPSSADLDRLTTICMALPEARCDDRHPPHRGFVVANKNVAWYAVDELVTDSYRLQAPKRLGRLLGE